MNAQFTRAYVIRSLHNLENPDITDQENSRLYGVCYRLHGHHYKVMVTIESEIDPRTGLCKFRRELDTLVNEKLVSRFDGHNLNETFRNTSGEALAHLFFEILRPHVPKDVRLKLSIQETRKNYFERPPQLG